MICLYLGSDIWHPRTPGPWKSTRNYSLLPPFGSPTDGSTTLALALEQHSRVYALARNNACACIILAYVLVSSSLVSSTMHPWSCTSTHNVHLLGRLYAASSFLLFFLFSADFLVRPYTSCVSAFFFWTPAVRGPTGSFIPSTL